MTDKAIKCSFCGKSQDSIERMIASPKERPGTYICSECVLVCVEILDEEDKPTPPQEDSPTVIPIWLARMLGKRKPS